MTLPDDALHVIGALDSRKKLEDIFIEEHTTDPDSICEKLGILLNMGFLQRISTEGKLALLQECILEKLLKTLIEYSNEFILKEYIAKKIKNGIGKYPWLSRVKVSDDLDVRITFEVGMSP
jgi:hypothetical protein